MICTLTARRLNPGAYDEFRAAWDATYTTHDQVRRWSHIYQARDLTDPDIVVSFGLFEGSADELRATQAGISGDAADLITPHVTTVLLDGSYEVLAELTPSSATP
ncbi:MAG: hypothetical protein ACRDLT_09570 [Solirubrobacteraceae bacterium]